MNKLAKDQTFNKYYALGANAAMEKLSSAAMSRAFNKTLNAGIAGGLGLFGGSAAANAVRQYAPVAELINQHTIRNTLKKQVDPLFKLLQKETDPASAAQINKIINDKLTTFTGDKALGAENLLEDLAPYMPGAAGVLGTLGIGSGLYRGLNKLDRKLLT